MDDKDTLLGVKLGHLAVERDREEFLRQLVELCTQAVDAERSTVYLVDHRRGEIRARIAQRAFTEIRLPIGSGLAGQVAATGETMNVPDAYADPRFDPSTDRRIGFHTRNSLIVPVYGRDGTTIVAVIQALNKREGVFERRDQMLLERIAEHVGHTLEQVHVEEVGR